MQRPSLNPVLVDELDAPRRSLVQWLLDLARRLRLALLPFRWLLFVLLTDLADPLHHREAERSHWRAARLVRGTVVVGGSLLFVGLHPPKTPGVLTPARLGLFFQDTTLTTADGQKLAAWVIPVLSEKRVLAEGARVLREPSPAVVLVHDAAGNRAQMLLLVEMFHNAGFVVVVPATRGCDTNAWATQTFGLREAHDVAAAVQRVREEPLVDPNRVAVVGVGAGATAAALAAARDPSLSAVVLYRPLTDADALVRQRIGPTHDRLAVFDGVCAWLMDVSYGLNLHDLNDLPQTLRSLPQPTLLLDEAPLVPDWRNAVGFLEAQLQPTAARTLGR